MSFILFANHFTTDLELPIRIYKDQFIQLATESEKSIIEKFCSDQIKGSAFHNVNPFNFIRYKDDGPIHKIDPKYWIWKYEGHQMDPYFIALIGLTKSSFAPTYEFSITEKMPPMLIPHLYSSLRIRELSKFQNATEIDMSEIELMKELLNNFTKLESRHNLIREALMDFKWLYHIPKVSSLIIVGLFAIIEKLLSSRKSVQINSINQQLQNKLVLLNNRSALRVDVFKDINMNDKVTAQKVIEKLYAFRSCIAHGERPNFSEKLFILKSREVALNLIMDLCKMVIINSIAEPDLVLDLRNC